MGIGIEVIPKTIDGMQFNIQQFTFQDSIDLETKTLSILAPGLDMLKSFKGIDEEIDLGDLGSTIQKILFTLKVENPFGYICDMVRNTSFVNGKENPLLDNVQTINQVFHGKTLTCMKLLLEIMKVNKFAFIEGLVGKGMNITGILQGITKKSNINDGNMEVLES